MNKKLAVIDLKAVPLILAASILAILQRDAVYAEPKHEKEAGEEIQETIADELAKLEEPGYSVIRLEKANEAGNPSPDLSSVAGRAAELQDIHTELKVTLSRLDRLNGPRELSQAATLIGEAFMLLSPFMKDDTIRTVTERAPVAEVEPELTEEEIEHAERGPAVHRNPGDGGADAPPAGMILVGGKLASDLVHREGPADISRVNPAAQNLSTVNALSLRERAEEAFNADAESKNWVQTDGKTPLTPFRDLPDAEKELWEAIVVEQEQKPAGEGAENSKSEASDAK